MTDDTKQNRTALIHVRMKPELRKAIENESATMNLKPSELVRKVLVAHFSKK